MASRSKKDDEKDDQSTEDEFSAPEGLPEGTAEALHSEESVEERQKAVAEAAKSDASHAESSVKAGDLPKGLTRAQFIAQQERSQWPDKGSDKE